MIRWLAAFAVTQLVEAPLYRTALGSRRHAWLIALGASALTHPVVFFVFPRVWTGSYWGYVAVAELFAVGVEALYLRAFGVSRPVSWALLANVASTAVGLGLRALTGWP